MSTYVMSDIHGQAEKFFAMLKKIHFSKNDTLYIIGDIIDRGPDSISIIDYVLEHSDNIIYMAGNHEKIMIDAILNDDATTYQLWDRNGGNPTYTELFKLPASQQEDIIDYMQNLIVIVPDLIVNEKHFYLTHSYPCVINSYNPVRMKDLSKSDLSTVLWSRIPYYYCVDEKIQKTYPNTTLIAGHTQNFHYSLQDRKKYPTEIMHLHKGHYINIDCGCASIPFYDELKIRLGCLRLNDFKEFYI